MSRDNTIILGGDITSKRRLGYAQVGTYGKTAQNRIAGGLYHVTSRGNARGTIYLDDEDRLNWLELFNEVSPGRLG
jgi:hypothetical protein